MSYYQLQRTYRMIHLKHQFKKIFDFTLHIRTKGKKRQGKKEGHLKPQEMR